MGSERTSAFGDFVEAYGLLLEIGVENPLLEALHLFDLLSGGVWRRVDLGLPGQGMIDVRDLAQKRKQGMPLEYIIGLASFMGRTFFCSPETFIPKEHTELLCRVALDFLKEMNGDEDDLAVIDMGTGCGNIAISLALGSESARVWGADISPRAIEVAQKNVDRFNLQDRVTLLCGDLFSPFVGLGCEESIDLVVCNPPYIPTHSLGRLPPEIVNYEPKVALDGGPFGIGFYRRLVNESLSTLRPKGILVFEIGVGQQELIGRLLEGKDGYSDVRYHGKEAEIGVVSASKRQ